MAEKARQPLPWDMRVLVRESGVEMPFAAFVPLPTRAEREMRQAMKCRSLMMLLDGAAAMYQMDEKGIITVFDPGILEKLKSEGYLKEEAPKHALEFIRLKNGEIFCLEHGAYDSPDPALAPREQLRLLGESNPELLQRARNESEKGWVRNQGDPSFAGVGELIFWIICSFLTAAALNKRNETAASAILLVLSAALAAIVLSEHLAILRTYL